MQIVDGGSVIDRLLSKCMSDMYLFKFQMYKLIDCFVLSVYQITSFYSPSVYCFAHACAVAYIFCVLAVIHFSHTVALLEFTQQLYSVQENLGPLIVNLRLASSSPSLATNLPANSIQAVITSNGGTAIGTCNCTVVVRNTPALFLFIQIPSFSKKMLNVCSLNTQA